MKNLQRENSVANTYRADIDGLRAIAVLSVLFFHLEFELFSGGFVGVDIFFVLSGFLITRLIRAEVLRTGTFRFGNFYYRRAKRLFPALFATLFLCFILAVCLFSAEHLERFGGALLHALTSLSNFYFWSESGYFDMDATFKPLLHTWSLSVEEQFYLVWPLVLVALLKYMPRFVLIALFLGGAASLFLNFIFADGQSAFLERIAPEIAKWFSDGPSTIFYLTPFRVFEFAMGAVLVWLIRYRSTQVWVLEVLALIGFALIFYPMFFYSKETLFPSFNALIPCLGAALLIYSGEAKYCGRVLRSKAFVGMGLISYSVYLIHWPIIVFYRYSTSVALSSNEQVIIVIASIICGFLMYRFIERPFRYGSSKPSKEKILSKPAYGLVCVGMMLVIALPAANIWANKGWPWRTFVTPNFLVKFDVKEERERRFLVKQKTCIRKGWATCNDKSDSQPNILILGDSMSSDAVNIADYIFKKDVNYIFSDLGGCPPYNKFDAILPPKHPDRDACLKLNKERYSVAFYDDVDAVFISVLMGWYTPQFFEDYLSFLQSTGVEKVVILGNYFQLDYDLPHAVLGKTRVQVELEVRENANNRFHSNLELKQLSEKYRYLFIDMKEELCESECIVFFENDAPFTWDKFHLSVDAANYLGERLKDRVGNYVFPSRSGSILSSANDYGIDRGK